MELIIDIGNTNVVIGFYQEDQWIHIMRLVTKKDDQARSFYDMKIREAMLDLKFDLDSLQGIYLSSVVPILTKPISEILSNLFEKSITTIGTHGFSNLKVSIDNPSEIGSDLIANAVAAVSKYNDACIVVDFGTALTFTTVTREFEILGVAIAPGLKTAMSALHSKTAQLPEVPLKLPEKIIGKNTTHAIQSGVLWGYVGLVKEMIKKIEDEVGFRLIPIATGGLSSILHPLKDIFHSIDQNLTLDGIMIIGRDHESNRA